MVVGTGLVMRKKRALSARKDDTRPTAKRSVSLSVFMCCSETGGRLRASWPCVKPVIELIRIDRLLFDAARLGRISFSVALNLDSW